MAAQIGDVLNWDSGLGWLVLSGGSDATGEVRAQAVLRGNAIERVAYLSLSYDAADDLLDDMEDLGAPTGYVVNIVAEEDDVIRKQIAEASIVMLSMDSPPETLRHALVGAALDGVRDALLRGAVVLAEGSSAALMGAYFLTENGGTGQGFSWLENALVLPGLTALAGHGGVQALLQAQPLALALGIAQGSALVLGPDDSIETWGDGEVTIALGRDYSSSE